MSARLQREGDEGDRACAELQDNLLRARRFMDQSRRLLSAASTESKSFKPKR